MSLKNELCLKRNLGIAFIQMVIQNKFEYIIKKIKLDRQIDVYD